MHELGIINYVVRQVENLAAEKNFEKVHSVTLEFGEVSCIVTSCLMGYWNWYSKKHPVVDGAELRCETLPAITWCNSCEKTYPTVQYGKTCPYCGSGETWLLKGQEMNIKEIEVEE